jgi:hypothetical protein
MKVGCVKRNDALFIGSFILFALLPIFMFLNKLLIADESYFMFIGDKISHGSVLYKDFIDNKVPGIFYLNALAFFIFGKSFVVPRMILFMFNAMSALIIYLIGRKLWNENIARMSSIFFLISIYAPTIPGSDVLTEQFVVFFGLLGFFVFLKSHYWKYLILTGFLLGVAMLFKQVGVLFYLIICMYYILNLRAKENRNNIYIYQSIKSLILILCGLIVPVLLATLYFYRMGVIHEFIYWSFTFFIEGNYGYRIDLFRLMPPLRVLTILWILASFSAVSIIYKYIANKYSSSSLFALIWLLAFVSTLAIRQHPQYLITILPPVCLLTSVASEKFLHLFYLRNIRKTISKKEIIRGVVIICILGLATFNIYMIVSGDNRIIERNDLASQINASNFITLHTKPGEKILSFPFEPFIYFMSGRDPAVKYPFFVHYPTDRIEALRIVDELNKSKIRYIVVSTTDAGEGNKDIYQFIIKNYFRINQNYFKWTIYELDSIGQHNASDWTQRGISFGTQGMYNESVQAFEKALDLRPDYGPAWINKGLAFFKLEKYNESLQAYSNAIEINPNNADAWNGKAIALYKMDQYEDALKASSRALEIEPNVAGYWNKFLVLKSLHRDAEAEAALSKVKELAY